MATNLRLSEEYAPFPALRERELHRFRIACACRQPAHVVHMPHATRRGRHQPGN
jgi:hypothetical protein